jgi:hypothetical protein
MNYRVLLLACSAAKLDRGAQAVDIYQGQIFRKGLEYAKREGLWVMILSAKHGLINWDTWVEPYDQKMKGDYRGPWPQMEGFYLGGQLYFAHAPERLKPLVPSGTIGFMLRDLNRLLDGTPREELFK